MINMQKPDDMQRYVAMMEERSNEIITAPLLVLSMFTPIIPNRVQKYIHKYHSDSDPVSQTVLSSFTEIIDGIMIGIYPMIIDNAPTPLEDMFQPKYALVGAYLILDGLWRGKKAFNDNSVEGSGTFLIESMINIYNKLKK